MSSHTHFPISAEARGKLRLWKAKAACRYVAFERRMPDMRADAKQFVARQSAKGRLRVWERIRTQVPGLLWDVRFEGKAPLALWAVLEPRHAVIVGSDNPSDMQDCVLVNFFLFGACWGPGSCGFLEGGWTLEIPDHALGRLIQRDPQADISAVLLHGHQAALELPSNIALNANVLLPAGSGVFAGGLCFGQDVCTDTTGVVVRVRTWLHNDQLGETQCALPEAPIGHRLGDGMLLPHPLRQIEVAEGMLTVSVPDWVAGFGSPRLDLTTLADTALPHGYGRD